MKRKGKGVSMGGGEEGSIIIKFARNFNLVIVCKYVIVVKI